MCKSEKRNKTLFIRVIISSSDFELRRRFPALKMKDTQNCEICNIGVLLGTAREICRLADKHTNNKVCNTLYEQAVMGDISIENYLRRNLNLVSKDKEAKFTIKELLNNYLTTQEKTKD